MGWGVKKKTRRKINHSCSWLNKKNVVFSDVLLTKKEKKKRVDDAFGKKEKETHGCNTVYANNACRKKEEMDKERKKE